MIDVIKQLVESLEWCHGGEPIGTAEAIKAGRQAIAELEQRTWVGLTDEEISELSKGHIVRSTYARAIEAKLKDKNCVG